MMSIVRCPYCGKSTVAVGARNANGSCTRCGRALASATKLSRSNAASLTEKVREQLRGAHGLRPR